jgi:hypothetical protein
MTPTKEWPHAPIHRIDSDGIYMTSGNHSSPRTSCDRSQRTKAPTKGGALQGVECSSTELGTAHRVLLKITTFDCASTVCKEVFVRTAAVILNPTT